MYMPDQLAGRAAAAEVLDPGILGGRIIVATLFPRTGAKDEEPNRQLLAHVGVFLYGRTSAVLVGGGVAEWPAVPDNVHGHWKNPPRVNYINEVFVSTHEFAHHHW